MTISQAIENKISAVRKPYWNKTAKLELPEIGLWCKLHDVGECLNIPLVEVDDGETDWEVFKEL